MGDESQTVNQRLRFVRDAVHLNPTDFSAKLGVPRTSLLGWESGKSVPIETLSGLVTLFNVNPDWFLTGEGPPFRDTKNDTVSHLEEATGNVVPIKNHDHRGVPYYDIEATAHIAEVLDGGDRAPEYYVDFQPFNDCTAYLQVYGSSMYPAITSGEVVAVKEIKNFDVILWGEMYLVIANADQNDLRAVKTVHQHEDDSKIILRSSNPNFKGDTVIPKESIIKMFLVKGKISRGHL